MRRVLMFLGLTLCSSMAMSQTGSFSMSLDLGKKPSPSASVAKNFQSPTDYYLEGGYGVIPRFLNLPLTWYAPVNNDSTVVLNAVTATISHIHQGDTTLIASVSHGNIASWANDTVVIDYRNFFNAERPGWYGNSPIYGTTTIPNSHGFDTWTLGQNKVQAKLTANGQVRTYPVRTYRVVGNTNYGYNDYRNGYRWGWDNGIIASGINGERGYHVGIDDSGYVVINGLDNYQNSGYTVLVRYTTPSIIPTDADGEPWVMRGIEVVTDPEVLSDDLNGSRLIPQIYKAVYTSDSTVRFQPVISGNNATTQFNGYELSNFLISGYMVADENGQYHAANFFFPEQPVLEPNTSYYIGYRMAGNGHFAAACNSTEIIMFDETDEAYYLPIDSVPAIAGYGTLFTPSAYDVVVEDNGVFLWASAFIDKVPMIRAVIGPNIPLAHYNVSVDCNSGSSVFVYYGDTVCGQNISMAEESKSKFNIYPQEGNILDGLYIDGIGIQPYNSNTGEGDEHFHIINEVAWEYTFDDIHTNHTISATSGTPCLEIAVNSITDSSIDFTWTGSCFNGFDIEYGSAGFEHGTGTSVTVEASNHSYFIGGLSSNTDYDIYVRRVGHDWCTALTVTTALKVTVEVNDEYMGSVTGGGFYQIGDTATLTASARYHYHFDHWSNAEQSASSTDNPLLFTVTCDTTLFAVFAPDRYQINVVSNDTVRGTVSGGGEYDYLDTITLTATAVEHYHFVQWSNEWQSYYDNPLQFVVTGDRTITAYFSIDEHTVVATSNDDMKGVVSGGGTFDYGSPCTLTAIAYTGYQFAGWSNGQTANPYAFPVTGDVELVAMFVEAGAETATVTALSADPTMGTATVNGGSTATVMAGDSVMLVATSNEGYRFVRWNDNSPDSIRTVVVTSDIVYIAYFQSTAVQTYTVTATSSDPTMGVATVNGGSTATVTEGEMVTLVATANDGYRFVRWNDNNTDSSRTVVVAGDMVYIAYFNPVPTGMYTVTVTCNDPAMGRAMVNDDSIAVVEPGETVILTAIPGEGYRFVRWNDNNTDNIRAVVVIGDMNFVAYFEVKQNPNAIDDVMADNFMVYQCDGQIVVECDPTDDVMVYDAVGRLLTHATGTYSSTTAKRQSHSFGLGEEQNSTTGQYRVPVPASGVYLVKVGDHPARRIVVVRM